MEGMRNKKHFFLYNQLLNLLSVSLKTFLSAGVSLKKKKNPENVKFYLNFYFQICLQQCRSAL